MIHHLEADLRPETSLESNIVPSTFQQFRQQEGRSFSQSRTHSIYNMNASTELTLVLLLFSFAAFNGVRYWLRVPYGSGVGSFIWITHRGMLLSYTPGVMALTAEHSCQVPIEGTPHHALCHIPYVGREWTFAAFAVASAGLWVSALTEVVLYWKSHNVLAPGEAEQEDHTLGDKTNC